MHIQAQGKAVEETLLVQIRKMKAQVMERAVNYAE